MNMNIKKPDCFFVLSDWAIFHEHTRKKNFNKQISQTKINMNMKLKYRNSYMNKNFFYE